MNQRTSLENRNDFASRVSLLCHEQYEKLPKRGKPQSGKEWTCLSGFVETKSSMTGAPTDDDFEEINVVCLATGTKCLGASARSLKGDVINDSHAEILAKRLLVRYLYEQLTDFFLGKESVFCYNVDKEIVLMNTVKYHMYISHTPCGDASIFPKEDSKSDNNDGSLQSTACVKNIGTRKRRRYSNESEEGPMSKKKDSDNSNRPDQRICDIIGPNKHETSSKDGLLTCSKEINSQPKPVSPSKQDMLSEAQRILAIGNLHETSSNNGSDHFSACDIYRTGAKCVPKGKQDPHLDGEGYHITSALRIKPGRGDRTISMSCSDKIMRWCCLGLQGTLLSNFIAKPIILSSVVFGKCPSNVQSIERAFSLRNRDVEGLVGTSERYFYRKPSLHFSNSSFQDSRERLLVDDKQAVGGRRGPAGSAILWCKYPVIHEVACNGRKQGITKAKLHLPEARVSVCRLELLKCFLSAAKHYNNSLADGKERFCTEGSEYCILKTGNKFYTRARDLFFTVFQDWTSKPINEKQFTAEIIE